jgi:glycosyltransferase involved in cell wall biosynthesis
MKVAIVQDWFVVNGGAEKVVKEIITLFPNCDIFSLIDFLNDEDRAFILQGKKATTSFLQKLPFAKEQYRYYLPLFPLAIESLDLKGYDLIISSSYSVAKGIKKKKGQIHICYCHSPIRYAWDLESEYTDNLPPIKRFFAKITLKYIRKWDKRTTARVDLFIANSKNVSERIKRIYNRDSFVLYPPIDTSSFKPEENKSNYYFSSARMVPYKKLDLIVGAFNEMPNLKLIVSGDGPELSNLIKIGKENIEFIGFVKKKSLISYIQKAKAFILAADEDFGITSVEAQSCCTPVVALEKGGYLETVVENKTGFFFKEQSIKSIKEAILKIESREISLKKNDFISNVERFSIENFQIGFRNIVNIYFPDTNN